MTDPPPPPSADNTRPAPVRRSFLFEAVRLSGANMFGSFMQVLIGIATIRIWSVEARGHIEVAIALPSMLSIVFDLGLGRVLPYMIGKQHAPIGRLLSTTFILWLTVSVIGVGVVIWYHTSGLAETVPSLWLTLAILIIPFRLFVGIVNGFCVGVERLGFKASLPWIREPIVFAVLLGLAAFPALRQIEDAWIRILSINLGYAITSGMGIWLMTRYARISLKADPALLRDMSVRSVTFGIGPLCLDLLQFTPSLLLTFSVFAVPAAAIGNYTVGAAMAMLLMQLAYASGHVLMSRSVNATDMHAQSRKALRLVRVGVVGASLMGVVMAIGAPILVPLVYGADTDRAPWIMMILLPGIVGFFALHTLSTDLIARGKPGVVAIVAGAGLTMNIAVCSAYSIPTYGIWGAAATTAAIYIVTAIAMIIVYVRITGVPLREAITPRVADFPIQQVVGRFRRKARST